MCEELFVRAFKNVQNDEADIMSCIYAMDYSGLLQLDTS